MLTSKIYQWTLSWLTKPVVPKEMLLAVGDRYEKDIAAAKAADAKYR